MALGKNIKKQQLIPRGTDATSSSEKKGDKKNKKDNPQQKKAKAIRQEDEFKDSQKPGAINTPAKGKQETEAIQEHQKEEKLRASKTITTSEYQRREKLQAKFAEEVNSLKGKKVHLIVFRLGTEEYALEIAKTRKVVVTPPIVRAPHTPDYVKGVANIRGSVIMAIDLASKFNLKQANAGSEGIPTYTLVIKNNRYNVGILINEVPATLVVDGDTISSSTGIMADASIHETYIKGVIKANDRMVFFIDIDELLDRDMAGVLPEMAEMNEDN